MKMYKSKRGQMSGGLVTGLVFGIATLIVAVIIAFVVVNTLTDANLLTETRTSSTVTNETGATIDETGYQLAGLNTYYVPGSITIVQATNSTDGVVIPAANYTVSSTGLLTNNTILTYEAVNVTYSYSIYSATETSSSSMSGNFTSGVDNVSSKIPTVLLVAAIVLILGVLVLLVATWRKMQVGGADI